MQARLLLEAGEATPAVLEMAPGQSVRIGRHRDNTVILRDEHASRWHAEIFDDRGQWFIRNVGNPLNGTRISREDVADFMMQQIDSPLWIRKAVYIVW